ncbi:MAG: chloride channel protein [Algoriphagus sp.]|jgi:chloride channel protein, CIC family|uniref:chloride channel protein n=1 Tax=Algoriphagus sp. TaxID=1872435 RepID=UPI0027724F70|nr:chloride channel protein [Algoriphagus sp.]MDP4747095.1 chloride channel protein [Algoriphagus sp.]MDP4839037.1 chloride channel protein [Algoriphagus sp.]MDP4904087.1 chloride channel protein [Algoriphagus sp.]MDP4958011.1 chloride channel protein [Algoriphagus sp.]
MSNQTFILILSGCIGIFSGIAAVLLKTGVHTIQNFLTEDFYPSYANFMYILYPLIGITTAFLLGKYVLKDFGGHGIPDVLFSISKKSSLLPRVKIFSRVLTSSFTVGFGGSVGLEAPMVMTGSAIGSNVGALMHLNAKKRTLLIGCGAAGAISAIFGAPIGAVIFAIEVILMEISTASFIPLLIASVTGSLTSMLLIGEDSLFNFNLKDSFQATHMPYYLLLGIISGLVSLYFSKMVVATERLMGALGSHWMRITYGGAFLGFMVFLFPPIYGEGYQTLNVLIDGNATEVLEKSLFFSSLGETKTLLLFLIGIILLKPIASAITIGAGGSGGIFAPSLFVGGITGFVFAYSNNLLGIHLDLPIAHFVLVAMCGVMAGVQHSPLSAIFLIAEITGGYELFVPLMFVSAISFITKTYFQKHSVYTLQLKAQGKYLPETKDEELLDNISITQVIEKDLLPIHPDAQLTDLIELVKLSKRNIFPVVDSAQVLQGIVTLDDIRHIMFDAEKQKIVRVKQLMHSPPEILFSSENMQSAMEKFERSGAWNLPVVDNNQYLGFVSKAKIFNAYRKKLQRQKED